MQKEEIIKIANEIYNKDNKKKISKIESKNNKNFVFYEKEKNIYNSDLDGVFCVMISEKKAKLITLSNIDEYMH